MGGLFDKIAVAYGLFFNYQKRYYQATLKQGAQAAGFMAGENILDVGCGTGALCSALRKATGLKVTGVDRAKRMLAIAGKRTEGEGISFQYADVLEGLPFKDGSFDFSIASFVAHGLSKEERRNMYLEMKRVTKRTLILHDYGKKRALLTDFVEWLEGGDYFNFINVAASELESIFKEVEVLELDSGACWYIVKLDDKEK